ncbi:MAG: carotene isomerase, partial [Synechococcaceae cyanobacterium]|nr:carotene isomerase [Synechococcaceae cyanobacterium]
MGGATGGAVGLEHQHLQALAGGETLSARAGVILNLSPWDSLRLLPEEALPRRWRRRQEDTPACLSFLHWHLGL